MANCLKCSKSIFIKPERASLPAETVCHECGGTAELDDHRNLWTGIINMMKGALGVAILITLMVKCHG